MKAAGAMASALAGSVATDEDCNKNITIITIINITGNMLKELTHTHLHRICAHIPRGSNGELCLGTGAWARDLKRVAFNGEISGETA